jgi:hypothetical protein
MAVRGLIFGSSFHEITKTMKQFRDPVTSEKTFGNHSRAGENMEVRGIAVT